MKKILSALILVGLMSTSAIAVDVIAGGQVPLINNVIGIGMMTLDFGSAGTDVEVAQFFINNNSTTWDLTIECNTSGNGGAFKRLGAAATITELSALEVEVGSLGGVLGAGATTFAVGAAGDESLLLGNPCNWSAGAQTTATQMYNLRVIASWGKTAALAGLYTETITATIIATM